MLFKLRREVQRDIETSLAVYREGQASMREESVPDVEDLSVRNSAGDQGLSLIESKSRTREQIDEALRRLDEGIYGRCECRRDIGKARLQALPFARRCLTCKEQAETIEQIERKEERVDM